MTVARTATAAAVAGLVAVAAWSASLGPIGPERVAVGTGVSSGALAGFEWQLAATGEDRIPPEVLGAASSIRIATVDTGADVAAPDIAARNPRTHDARNGSSGVADANGHGTFVASLVAGFGGQAQLLIVKAG